MLEKIKNKLNTIGEIKIYLNNIFIFSFLIYLMNLQLSISTYNISNNFENVLQLIRYLYYGVASIKFLKSGLKYYKNIKIDLFILISVIVSYCAKDLSPIILVVTLVNCIDLNKEKILKFTFWSNFITFIFIITSDLIGIIPDWTFPRNDIVRHSLGYQYCTFASTISFFILLNRFYCKKGKIKIYELVFWVIISLLLYRYTDSRTGMFLNIFIITISLFSRMRLNLNIKLKDKNKIIFLLAIIILLFAFFGSLILAVKYNKENDFYVKLNDILSDRIRITHNVLNKTRITLFGQKMIWQGWGGFGYTVKEVFEYNFVDNSYMKNLLSYGIIYTLYLGYLYIKQIYKMIKENNYIFIFCILIVICWASIEPSLLSISKNVFLIYLL